LNQLEQELQSVARQEHVSFTINIMTT
jgi:hypothetical protein